MLLNIGLLILLFGAEKKKLKPYVAACALGVIKAVIYGVVSRSVVVAVMMGAIFAGLAAAFVYFLRRLDRREDAERPETPVYRSAGSEKITFRWEYLPLVALLLLIIGGEVLLA